MIFSQYTSKTIEEVLAMLKSSRKGLTRKDAALALEKYGPNQIKASSLNAWNIFKRQIKSPFFYLLFLVSLISLAIGEFFDFSVIIFIVLANISIGFFQEYRAEKAVFLLKKFVPQEAKVLRDNKEQVIEKSELVVGDIVLLEAGDAVGADIRLIKAHNLLADESALSGESAPVLKHALTEPSEKTEVFEAKNIVFTGTSLVSGKAEGVVVATAKGTVFGQIAETLIKDEYKMSSYEKDIFYFSKLVLRVVVVTVVLIFVANLFIKGPGSIVNFLLFCTALIISILPEGLPAVVSFALAKGSMQMAKRNVVVKRLSAIERLGNIDVLCTDKTGTLTRNKLSLEKIVSSDKRKCLLYGFLSSYTNEREQAILNPFDLALYERTGSDFKRDSQKNSVVHEFPFDSIKMLSGVVIKDSKGQHYAIIKGAPEFVLELCSKVSDGTGKKDLREDFEREGMSGKRVLAVAFKKTFWPPGGVFDEDIFNKGGFTFLGYFVFEDTLKETSEEAIRLAKKLGVKIKLISGDSREVSEHVGRKIKLILGAGGAISSRELLKMAPDEFDQACEENDVFARISPQLKYKIVKSLQKNHDVGFLGDGVNDAPALKMADVGIAVEGSADVSKAVSDVILLKRDLRVIVEGIEQGRHIFANINKYIKCMLASNFGNFYSIAVISLFIDFLPMLPIQILLSNLLSDLPLISTVTDTVDADELKKPKAYHLRSVLPLIINLAIIITISDFVFFSIFRNQAPSTIQTLWFIESVFCELLLVFIIRTKGLFWKAKRPSTALVVSVVAIFAVTILLPFLAFGQKIAHFVAPQAKHLLILAGILAVFTAVSELVKYLYFKYFRKKEERLIVELKDIRKHI